MALRRGTWLAPPPTPHKKKRKKIPSDCTMHLSRTATGTLMTARTHYISSTIAANGNQPEKNTYAKNNTHPLGLERGFSHLRRRFVAGLRASGLVA